MLFMFLYPPSYFARRFARRFAGARRGAGQTTTTEAGGRSKSTLMRARDLIRIYEQNGRLSDVNDLRSLLFLWIRHDLSYEVYAAGRYGWVVDWVERYVRSKLADADPLEFSVDPADVERGLKTAWCRRFCRHLCDVVNRASRRFASEILIRRLRRRGLSDSQILRVLADRDRRQRRQRQKCVVCGRRVPPAGSEVCGECFNEIYPLRSERVADPQREDLEEIERLMDKEQLDAKDLRRLHWLTERVTRTYQEVHRVYDLDEWVEMMDERAMSGAWASWFADRRSLWDNGFAD